MKSVDEVVNGRGQAGDRRRRARRARRAAGAGTWTRSRGCSPRCWRAGTVSRPAACSRREPGADARTCVRRFVAFTGGWPWQWTPSDVEDWTATCYRRRRRERTRPCAATTTGRAVPGLRDRSALRLGAALRTAVRHAPGAGLPRVEHRPPHQRPTRRGRRFARSPATSCRASSTTPTTRSPGPQRGPQGWVSAFRDATLFKVSYAWGLRRRRWRCSIWPTSPATPPRRSSAATAPATSATARPSKGSPAATAHVLTIMGLGGRGADRVPRGGPPALRGRETPGSCGRPNAAAGSRRATINKRFADYRDALGADPPSCTRTACATPTSPT